MIAFLANLALVIAVAFALIATVFAGSFLVVYAVLSLIGIVASRFDISPEPYGVHGMAADHPEQVPTELTDYEEATFNALVDNTEWDKA